MSPAVDHPVFAPLYPRVAAAWDAAGGNQHRQELLAGVAGQVVELGGGNGAHFPHYPAEVQEILAVEPEPRLRRKAEQAARQTATSIQVVDADADTLDPDGESFDVAVTSLVLCSVPDPGQDLQAPYRALRPGGQLRFYEHVRSSRPTTARLQDTIDVLWPTVAGGCHCNRDTLTACRRVHPRHPPLVQVLAQPSAHADRTHDPRNRAQARLTKQPARAAHPSVTAGHHGARPSHPPTPTSDMDLLT